MTRKDSEKEADRPHYYSQFWLDVAAGRKVIGGGLKTDEADSELETAEPELEPEPVRRSGRNVSSVAATHEETPYAASVTQAEPELEPEPEFAEEEFAEPEPEPEFALDEEEFDQDQELPNILVEEEEIPDMDLVEEDEEDFFDEEEEDEEDEEGWGRGRKKPKPGRQAKLPSKPPAKKPRRDRRY